MAVTIGEMHVETEQSTKAPAASAAPAGEPAKKVDLQQTLALMRERELRLRAD